jgi:hypothetical protein
VKHELKIHSVGFSCDFKWCVVSVNAEQLPRTMFDIANYSGTRVLEQNIRVIRGVMPTKAQILKAARTAVRRHLRKLAKDRKERALLEAAGAYAGTTFEIEEKS